MLNESIVHGHQRNDKKGKEGKEKGEERRKTNNGNYSNPI